MTEKTDDVAKARLEKLKKQVFELDELSHKSFYHSLLLDWLSYILGITVGALLVGVPFGSDFMVASSRFQDVVPFIFGATITVNGIMIGFASATGFNIARGIIEEWQELKGSSDTKTETKSDERALIDLKGKLETMCVRNFAIGTRKYVSAYVILSALVELILVLSYTVLVTLGLYLLFILVNCIFLLVAIFGIVPLTRASFRIPEQHMYTVKLKDVWNEVHETIMKRRQQSSQALHNDVTTFVLLLFILLHRINQLLVIA